MRLKFNPVLLTILIAEAAWAGPSPLSPPSPWNHTRPLSAGAIGLIASGSERSSIITGLLEDLEQTDVVVYVTDSFPWVASGPASYLTFLSCDATLRYVLVRIDFGRLSPSERIAWLGHELQHALEVAAAPEVRGASELVQLYRRIGWEGEKDRFETEEAKTIGNRVRSEVSGRVASSRRMTPPRRVSP